MLREAFRPLFLLLWVCMWMTAATELGPDQWVGSLITQLTGMQGILILVYTAGLMFVLRYFGGGVAHYVSPFALLTGSAMLTTAGLYGLSQVTTPTEAFLAATLFGVRQNVLLADDAGDHVGAVPARRGAAVGADGRHGESSGGFRAAGDGRLV